MGKIDVRKLRNLLHEIVENQGYECVKVDIDFAPSSGRTTVRIFIDMLGGIGHEDCERTSRSVSGYLDACEEAGAPWFTGKYFVEVSSPGVERPLYDIGHYRRFAGSTAAIHTKSGSKVQGRIESVDEDDNVAVALEDGSVLEIPFEDIKRANLTFSVQKGKKNTGKQKNIKGKKRAR